MAAHKEQRLLPYSPELIFDLVADVESYPAFLPLWKQAKVSYRQGNVYSTDQVIQIGPARKRFRSKTVLQRPKRIDITSSDRLFRHFAIRWIFEPTPDGACRVDFVLTCEARSRLLQGVFDVVLLDAAQSIVSAFEKRARELYGPVS